MVAANARTAITFALSPGQASDSVEGRELLGGIGPLSEPLYLIMDRAYEDNETRQLALNFGFIPVVPPKSNRLEPWQYDRAMYRKRNEIERLFGGSRASAVSSRALKNWTSFSSASLPSP
jgi:transposase